VGFRTPGPAPEELVPPDLPLNAVASDPDVARLRSRLRWPHTPCGNWVPVPQAGHRLSVRELMTSATSARTPKQIRDSTRDNVPLAEVSEAAPLTLSITREEMNWQ